MAGALAGAACGSAAVQSAPTHTITWINLVGSGVAHSFDVAAARPWVTWAMVNINVSRELNAAGVKTVYYTDPSRPKLDKPGWSDNEALYAHDCNGGRVEVNKRSGGVYLSDPDSAVTRE